MVTYVKYEPFIQKLVNGDLDLFGTEDTVKAIIHSDAPVVATDAGLADLTQVTGSGYTAGGEDTQNNATRTGAVVTETATTIVWTATAADWIAARYVSRYDDTIAGDPLINYWDYASNFTLGNGETFTLSFGASVATYT